MRNEAEFAIVGQPQRGTGRFGEEQGGSSDEGEGDPDQARLFSLGEGVPREWVSAGCQDHKDPSLIQGPPSQLTSPNKPALPESSECRRLVGKSCEDTACAFPYSKGILALAVLFPMSPTSSKQVRRAMNGLSSLHPFDRCWSTQAGL